MKNFHNIEKSHIIKGDYVGYGAGIVWRIHKTNTSYGNWVAYPQSVTAADHRQIFAFTLAQMSSKLEEIV